MLQSIHILLALWINVILFFNGCAGRAPSLRMLDTRAGYNAPYDDEEVALYRRARAHVDSIGKPMGPRIAQVYVYPHELPSQDYFWGGYLSLVIRRDEVVFDAPIKEPVGTQINDDLPKEPSGSHSLNKTKRIKKREIK